jgi:hypothetical protein
MWKPARRRRGRVAFALLAAAISLPATVWARPEGITGYSGKQGETCTDRCHSGGTPPMVHFEGPTALEVGAMATFRFVVESGSPQKQPVAGFNVAASGGTLAVVPGENERVEADELTQISPKEDSTGVNSWDFIWVAPSEPGPQTLYGAGLSANGNGTNGGDDAATATLVVTVTSPPQPGDANCDGRLSAADATAIVLQAAGGAPGACGLADASCDGMVDADDLAALSFRLFEGTSTPCT